MHLRLIPIPKSVFQSKWEI